MTHHLPVRIYFEDTDAGGIVYHASYLKFAERARTELLRHLGFENKTLKDKGGLIFVVRHIDAHYLSPAFLDDLLEVETTIPQIKNASFKMHQVIKRQNVNIFSMDVALVCVDSVKQRPLGIPPDIRHKFETFGTNTQTKD